MPVTRFAGFPVLSIDPWAGISREIFTASKQIMPDTRFTEFPALSIDRWVRISQSASETDV